MKSHWGASRQRTTFGSLNRSQLMSRIRSKGNESTEERLARLLRSAGLTGWRRHARLIGRPDFLWRQQKVAVFVDGCFWHGHGCGRNLTPKRNQEAWRAKILANQRRDRRVARVLQKDGWRVIRIWECALTRSTQRSLRRLQRALQLRDDRRLGRTCSRTSLMAFGPEKAQNRSGAIVARTWERASSPR